MSVLISVNQSTVISIDTNDIPFQTANTTYYQESRVIFSGMIQCNILVLKHTIVATDASGVIRAKNMNVMLKHSIIEMQ